MSSVSISLMYQYVFVSVLLSVIQKNTASVICGCRIFSYLSDLHFLVYHGVAHSLEQVARKDEVSQFFVV